MIRSMTDSSARNIAKPYCTAFEPTHTYTNYGWVQTMDQCKGGTTYTLKAEHWVCRTCLRPSKAHWKAYKQRCSKCSQFYTAPEIHELCPKCFPQLTWRQLKDR